jgi:glutamine synthetase
MVGNRERAANVEVKCTDLAANPYLALAGLLAAGLDGVARGLPLGEPITDDPARLDEAELSRRGIRRLPMSLADAVGEFQRSTLLRAVLGDVLADAVVAVREGEQRRAVSLTDEQVAEAYRWVY